MPVTRVVQVELGICAAISVQSAKTRIALPTIGRILLTTVCAWRDRHGLGYLGLSFITRRGDWHAPGCEDGRGETDCMAFVSPRPFAQEVTPATEYLKAVVSSAVPVAASTNT